MALHAYWNGIGGYSWLAGAIFDANENGNLASVKPNPA